MTTTARTPASKLSTRLRLAPEERIPLILDAALAEFSLHGYEAARIDAIAARAGLSKGGFYAHFASKDEVFEALLRSVLGPPNIEVASLLDGAKDLRQVLERLVDLLSVKLSDPNASAVFRLLLAEGWRRPNVVGPWHREAIGSVLGAIGSVLEQCAQRGMCRSGVLQRNPWFVLSPFIHVMTQRLVPGLLDPLDIPKIKGDLVEMLHALLKPEDR